ncbi:glycosyl hydrolase 53 family protein [Desulfurococcus amylolyticus]|uniref:glycosyl hydrolase 53 family protein n=1 Tax=Desulfurococcus amylolyticus TaxID=94694 RepID=UPI0023F21869|nr:glycosyl hydrolase 53 family protein [Desulfurococcus amylolyticus]
MNRLPRLVGPLILVASLLAPLLSLIIINAQSSSTIHVNPVPGLSRDFLRGLDLSEVSWILGLGGKYYYEDGREGDILDIIADNGVNAVRLRVWNDPYDEKGVPYGGGNCDLERMTQFASKVKSRGFKLLIDFHYSDWWADPSKQYKPKAWANLSFNELVSAVYNWTRDALLYMKNNNALPDMVQVGNEINNGFLWPDGRVENWTQFVTLLKSAIKAIRDIDPSIKIVIHLSGNRELDYYVNFFKRLANDGVDYDVIALSYYTYWHGSLEKLKQIASTLTSRFNKEIILAEIAYPWTLEDADGYPNLFSSRDQEIKGGYRASVQGQASLIRDIIEALYESAGDKALGVFYWGAAWIPVPGAGWKTGEGNPWENQALFDFNGKALPSLRVFRMIYEAEYIEAKPVGLYNPGPLNVTAYAGSKPVLLENTLVVYSDDSIRNAAIKWGEIPVYESPGTYYLNGYVENTSIMVVARITVLERLYIDVGDPEGDDKGPGTYGYPTASVYAPGVFDIVRASLEVESEDLVVRVYFKNLGGNPWNGPNGFSLQYIQVYIRTTNPLATNKVYRRDTFGLNIELRDDYAWQYALLISPGWGSGPLPDGELSSLHYANGTVLVEGKDFKVSSNTSDNYVEVRTPLNLLSDWENLKSWKIIVAVASWAGENPDRIRSFAPGGGEWLSDPVAYANESSKPLIQSALLVNVLPKMYDLLIYSQEYPHGLTADQQYTWLMGFNPSKSTLAIIPPEVKQIETVTQTITMTITTTLLSTTEKTVSIYETQTGYSGYTVNTVIGVALLSLALGIGVGYFLLRLQRK